MATSDGQHSAGGTLLVHDDGAFCFGPRDKVDNLLNVARYAAQWPLIPLAELHASSVQHPHDLSMRWLLHTRRVKCIPASGVAQPAEQDALPKSAGVGDRDATVWCCKFVRFHKLLCLVLEQHREVSVSQHTGPRMKRFRANPGSCARTRNAIERLRGGNGVPNAACRARQDCWH